MDLKESNILNDKISQHWYYQSKAKAVKNLLKNENFTHILDVGAGSGFFSRYLLDTTSAITSCCVDISYIDDSIENHHGKQILFRRSIESSNANLVLMMDVLEHVPNDSELLKHYVNKVPNNTKFLISVPAFMFLWSNHDVFLEHYRRYHLSQLVNVISEAGLQVQQANYYFGSVFPIAMTLRLFEKMLPKKEVQSQLKVHNSLVNSFLNQLCAMELPLQRYNKLAGLTIFCLAEKSG